LLPSQPDRRSNALRAERIIAADLLRVGSPLFDEALALMARWMDENPEASAEDAWTAMGPVIERGLADYVNRIYGVLIEDVPAGIDGL
jgi:hypothetical protein